MKIEELIAFLDVGEYGTELLDYGWGPTDVDDAITEIADGHVSIFKYDALRFLSAHPELVDDAIREYGWEACGGTLMGASNMAEYNFIRDELYSHLQATLAMSGAHPTGEPSGRRPPPAAGQSPGTAPPEAPRCRPYSGGSP